MTEDKKVAILQSNYIPWKGYFDIIAMADIFVFYDVAQYTKRDWRNRNKIKSSTGLQWLTIPIKTKGNKLQKLDEAEVQDTLWIKRHLRSIEINYRKAEFFPEVMKWIFSTYAGFNEVSRLSTINRYLILEVCKFLNIRTEIIDAKVFDIIGTKSEALVSILKQIGDVTHYISGSAAKSYLDEGLFAKNGISIIWMDYSDYPVYQQLYPPFVHEVSILDLLFNNGNKSRSFLKYTDK